jgi:uncharacterized protein YifE (UPF0438 family)
MDSAQKRLELTVGRRKLSRLFCECSTMDSVSASEADDPGSTPGTRTRLSRAYNRFNMSKTRVELLKTPFVPNTDIQGVFSPSELELMKKYGAWYQALADGLFAPETTAQRHFVSCTKWESDPRTRHEKAWRTYMKHLAKMKADSSQNKKNHHGVWLPSHSEKNTGKQNDANMLPHQITGGVVDQDEENYDPTAIH